MDDGEDVPKCPLCLEDLDATDRAMQPCKCSYVVCCWCLNHIREQLNGLCPACRTPYEEQNFTFREVSTEAAVREAKERATAKKERERRERVKELERERARATAASQQKARTNLKHARLVQRNLVYVIGLSLTLAREECLRRSDMFGRFGRIIRVLVNRAHPYNADAPGGPSISAYVQFSRDVDASSAARQMNNTVFDGREIRTAIACTKYCDSIVRSGVHCGNSDCMYIHEVSPSDDVLTREDVLERQLGPPPPSHLFVPHGRRAGVSATATNPHAGGGALAHGGGALAASAGLASDGRKNSPRSRNGSGRSVATSSAPAPSLPGGQRGGRSGGGANGGDVDRSAQLSSGGQRHANSGGSRGRSGQGASSGAQGRGGQAGGSASSGGGQSGRGNPKNLRSPPGSPHYPPVSASVGGRGGNSSVANNAGWPTASQSSALSPSGPGQRRGNSQQQAGQRGGAASAPQEESKRSRKRASAPTRNRGSATQIARTGSQQALAQPGPPAGFGAPPGFEAPVSSGAVVATSTTPTSSSVSVQPGGGKTSSAFLSRPPGFGAPRSISQQSVAGNSDAGGAPAGRGNEGEPASSTAPPGFAFPVAGGLSHVTALPRGPGPKSPSVSGLNQRQMSVGSLSAQGISDWGGGWPGEASARSNAVDRVALPVASQPSAPSRSVFESADAAFSGAPVPFPNVSIQPSFGQVRAPSSGPGLAPRPQFSDSILPPAMNPSSVLSGMPRLPNAPTQPPAAPTGIRPSRRNNSRFGFAREDPAAEEASPQPSLGGHMPSMLGGGGLRTGIPQVDPRNLGQLGAISDAGFVTGGGPPQARGAPNNGGKPAKSRFDFAESELHPRAGFPGPAASLLGGPHPVTSNPLGDHVGLGVSALTGSGGVASSVSTSGMGNGIVDPNGANGLSVNFAQLSTQDKLASLFQSAQWATQGLPPMPSSSLNATNTLVSKGGKTATEIQQQQQPDGLSSFPVPQTSTSVPSPNRKRSNSPLVPPGFREAAPESHTVDKSTKSVTAGVASTKQKSDDGKAATAARKAEGVSSVLQSNGSHRRTGRDGCEAKIPEGVCLGGDVGSGLESACDSIDSGKVEVVGCAEFQANDAFRASEPFEASGAFEAKSSFQANDASYDAEMELERQVEAARARKARLAAQLSDLQQQIRHFDNVRT